MAELLIIDGTHGEGGGAIIRTATALSALTGRGIRLDNIRAGQPNPGLATQHLAAVRAAASVCDGHLVGDSLASRTLTFFPRTRPKAGSYNFDAGGTGAATLILLTVFLPLVFAAGRSVLRIKGCTHAPLSPPYDYVADLLLPALARVGVPAKSARKAWGLAPKGEGLITLEIEGDTARRIAPLSAVERGAFKRVSGRAAAANLPVHVPQRLADRAKAGLRRLSPRAAITGESVHAASPGAALFLIAEYEKGYGGSSALGDQNRSSESVADEAVAALLAYHQLGAAFDRYLGDQLLPFLAFASGPSEFTVAAATDQLRTNAWVTEQFGLAHVAIEPWRDGGALVRVNPTRSALVVSG